MGRSKIDRKGFDGVVSKIKKNIYNGKCVHLLYVKNIGFVTQQNISVKNKLLIDAGKAFKVAIYAKGVMTEWIVDDCKEFLDGMVRL